MTKFVVDAGAVLQLAADGTPVADGHELLAPTLLRSQALSLMHEAVGRGELTAKDAQARLALVNKMKIRLLGDAVLRRTAWKVADQLGWDSTYAAEYVALTQLWGDALVTTDEKLAAAAKDLVQTAGLDALRS